MDSSTSTSSNSSESSVHPLDLLKLTKWKMQVLYQEEDFCLRQEVLHNRLVQNIRQSCKRSQTRSVTKRLRDSKDSSEDYQIDSKRKASDSRKEKKEEPSAKRIKTNFTGPFSSEDFMTHMYPKKTQESHVKKDPIILYQDRLSTFKNFKFDKMRNAKCTSKTLAQAGFISTGPTSAMCPFCLKSKSFTAFEDPWKEHERLGRTCSFLRIVKLDDSKFMDNKGLVQEAIAMANCAMWRQ